ncbi:MAG: hypothetical protein ACLGRW_19440 [Acidobacteriota bacterium]
MSARHSKATIVSMAVVASGLASLLHEGLGHGVTAWLRGDIVTELTSNQLVALHADRLVDAGGTLADLLAGAVFLIASRRSGNRANTRYFLWLLAALTLLPGAGYFLFSGIAGVGDWSDFIAGWPHQRALRIGMSLFGAALCVLVVRLLAVAVRPFTAERRAYNTVGRLPYGAACTFMCVAGAFDPFGIRLLLLSTVPAAFGGSSGLLWADSLMPRALPSDSLVVQRSRAWWIFAIFFAGAFVATVGRGITFNH